MYNHTDGDDGGKKIEKYLVSCRNVEYIEATVVSVLQLK